MENPKNVEYITDEHGNRKVVLPAETYEELLEDVQDLVAIAERKGEDTIPFEEVIKNLKKDGLI